MYTRDQTSSHRAHVQAAGAAAALAAGAADGAAGGPAGAAGAPDGAAQERFARLVSMFEPEVRPTPPGRGLRLCVVPLLSHLRI